MGQLFCLSICVHHKQEYKEGNIRTRDTHNPYTSTALAKAETSIIPSECHREAFIPENVQTRVFLSITRQGVANTAASPVVAKLYKLADVDSGEDPGGVSSQRDVPILLTVDALLLPAPFIPSLTLPLR
jgi:hypothetical protein